MSWCLYYMFSSFVFGYLIGYKLKAIKEVKELIKLEEKRDV